MASTFSPYSTQGDFLGRCAIIIVSKHTPAWRGKGIQQTGSGVVCKIQRATVKNNRFRPRRAARAEAKGVVKDADRDAIRANGVLDAFVKIIDVTRCGGIAVERWRGVVFRQINRGVVKRMGASRRSKGSEIAVQIIGLQNLLLIRQNLLCDSPHRIIGERSGAQERIGGAGKTTVGVKNKG